MKKLLAAIFTIICLTGLPALAEPLSQAVSLRDVFSGARKPDYLTGAEKYYQLLKTYTAAQLSDNAIAKAKADEAFAAEQFKTGQSNSFELLKSETEVLNQQQEAAEHVQAWHRASAELAVFMKKPYTQPYQPSPDTGTIGLSDDLALAQALENARQHRHGLPENVRNSTVTVAFENWQSAGQILNLCNQKLAMAETVVHQMGVSRQSGLSNDRDVLDARALEAQTRYEQTAAVADAALARFRLLEAMGMLDQAIAEWLKGSD